VFAFYSQLYNQLGELYANEPSQAALERSNQDAYDVIRLTRAARRLCGHWTVDDVARLIEIKKQFLFIYSFIFTLRTYDLGDGKN